MCENLRGIGPILSDPITCSFSDHRRRTCVVCHSGAGRLGTLKYINFRWQSLRMFNRLPKAIRMLSSCTWIHVTTLLLYLRNIMDLPCQPGFNNSLDGGDCLHGGHYADDLIANFMQINNQKKVGLPSHFHSHNTNPPSLPRSCLCHLIHITLDKSHGFCLNFITFQLVPFLLYHINA